MIEAAIRAEKEYLSLRLSGGPAVLDLTDFGYADLNDYFEDKREYLIKHCGIEIHETTMDNIESRVEAAVVAKVPSLWIPTADEVFVWHGSDPIDRALCEKLGVRVYDMNYLGGTIVSGPEDLSFAIIVPDSIDVGTAYMLDKIKGIMSKYLYGVRVDGNDILVGNEKVLGSMNRRVNGVYVFACQISYADRSDYIRQLCTKQSTKAPGTIDSRLLQKDVLKSEVIACLQ